MRARRKATGDGRAEDAVSATGARPQRRNPAPQFHRNTQIWKLTDSYVAEAQNTRFQTPGYGNSRLSRLSDTGYRAVLLIKPVLLSAPPAKSPADSRPYPTPK